MVNGDKKRRFCVETSVKKLACFEAIVESEHQDRATIINCLMFQYLRDRIYDPKQLAAITAIFQNDLDVADISPVD